MFEFLLSIYTAERFDKNTPVFIIPIVNQYPNRQRKKERKMKQPLNRMIVKIKPIHVLVNSKK